ncbi:hypothetical protein [Streptomyces sp. NPDC089799]|uniref:hypothetical protein n=1 Tax=Streptomyces sp. NPDC089799 TaxID=3155066 RepID=UPI0034326B53
MSERAPRATPGEDFLTTPRAAGVAGIVFALLMASTIVLSRIALPHGTGGEIPLDADQRQALSWSLQIVPFAGIAFLWFTGAVRAHTGQAEDRFIATVFLGSGLVFTATLFASAAAAGTVLNSGVSSEFGRGYAHTLLVTYALRMAAVYVASASAIGRRLGVMPRPLIAFGFLVALVLLVAASTVPWLELLFPAWALVVSLYILGSARRRPAA